MRFCLKIIKYMWLTGFISWPAEVHVSITLLCWRHITTFCSFSRWLWWTIQDQFSSPMSGSAGRVMKLKKWQESWLEGLCGLWYSVALSWVEHETRTGERFWQKMFMVWVSACVISMQEHMHIYAHTCAGQRATLFITSQWWIIWCGCLVFWDWVFSWGSVTHGFR